MGHGLVRASTGREVSVSYPDGIPAVEAVEIIKYAGYAVAEIAKVGIIAHSAIVKAVTDAKIVVEFYKEHMRIACEVEVPRVAFWQVYSRTKNTLRGMGLDPEDLQDALEELKSVKVKFLKIYP